MHSGSGDEIMKPLVQMRLDNIDLQVFLDTGASVSLMSADLYDRYFRHIPLIQSRIRVCDIHTQAISIVGSFTCTLEVAEMPIEVKILVAHGVNLGNILLLGHGACRDNGITLCPPKNGIIVGYGNSARFVPYLGKTLQCSEIDDNQKETCSIQDLLGKDVVKKGVLDEQVTLLGGKSHFVQLKIRGVSDGTDVLPIIGTERIKDVIVTSGLSKLYDGRVWIQVLNVGEQQRILNKGCFVVSLEVFPVPVKVVGENGINTVLDTGILSEEERTRREEILQNNLKGSHYAEYNHLVMDLLRGFPDVVAVKGDSLGSTNVLKHRIILEPGTRPIYIPAYRIPAKLKEEVERTVEDWEEEGIIQKSSSPFNFPLLAVPKKDGTQRVCVDFRKLNDKTIPDRFPAACLHDLMSEIGGRRIYSSIDLLQGFLQVPLHEDSRSYTAFSTTKGHYEFCRMPFGLKGSPLTFTRLVNTVFHGLLGKNVFVYMDDVLVATDSIEEHLEVLQEVFSRLRAAGLKLKLSKCDFLRKEIIYLGHVISQRGVRVNPKKIDAIARFPEPTSKRNVKQFLGLAGFFRKFVRNFSQIAAPLTDILKNEVPFRWEDKEREAFVQLKEALSNPPVLKFPDFNLPFFVATDASEIGLGACLMQKHGKDMHPIAFYSRKWRSGNSVEKNMSVVDKEACAVVDSLVHFKYLVMGCEITVLTDHKPLLELFNKPGLSPKRSRWWLTIQDFSPEFKYVQGKLNVVADALSRNIIGSVLDMDEDRSDDYTQLVLRYNCPSEWDDDLNMVKEDECVDWSHDKLMVEQDKDEWCVKAKEYLKGKSPSKGYKLPVSGLELMGNLLVRKVRFRTRGFGDEEITQVVVPRTLVPSVLKILHVLMGGHHGGVERTFHNAKSSYFWRNMYSDVERFVKNCTVCNSYKPSHSLHSSVNTYPVPSKPFARVHMDLITHFSESNKGNKHLLVVIDELTRYVEMYPLRNKTAEEVAVTFFNGFICRHGSPEVLISDNGKEFVNKLLDTLSDLMKIKKVNIQTYRPQANGLCERANRKILEAMRMAIGGQDPNWDNCLDYVRFAVNCTHHSAIGMSPHKALYGVDVRSPFDLLEVPRGCIEPIKSLVNTAKNRFQTLKECIGKYNEKMVEKANPEQGIFQFEKGDQVFVKINVRNELNYKLGPRYEGPFVVVGKLTGDKYRLKDLRDNSKRIVHMASMKHVCSKLIKKVRFNVS